MSNLTIPDSILSEEFKDKISISLGWTEEIEDTTAELEGDNYPLIKNPLTRDVFLSYAIYEEIKSSIIRRGREKLVNESKSLINKINEGLFDETILTSE